MIEWSNDRMRERERERERQRERERDREREREREHSCMMKYEIIGHWFNDFFKMSHLKRSKVSQGQERRK